MSNSEKIIVVMGATGQQGKGVVNSLKAKTDFSVRAVTRAPENYKGQADQVVKADLNDTESLEAAFEGAYGLFLVTNFWEQGTNEMTQAGNAIGAAKKAGIEHIVWSTLPDVKDISGGKWDVPHFTDKAVVDALIRAAGFKHYTFVIATFFYQNFLSSLAPQIQQDGSTGWVLPIARNSKSIHMMDINQLGDTVAGALVNPNLAGQGQYLPIVGDLMSFDDILATLEKQGKTYTFQQVPSDLFATFFPGARELAEMFAYFQEYTYLGGRFGAEEIVLEQKVAGRIPTHFADWAADNM